MNNSLRTGGGSPAARIAYIALMTALLTCGQAAFAFVPGVEIVTLLLVCFSSAFGVRDGVIAAAAFSLLRNFLWGFYPVVILLYLIYFPLLAAVFGLLGRIKDEFFDRPPLLLAICVNAVLAAIITAFALCIGLDLIKISRLYKKRLIAFMWVIMALCAALALVFDLSFALKRTEKIKSGRTLKTVTFTAVAAVCTICFSLLDDVIEPIAFGMTQEAALVYFYGSFLAMLPQTVCTIATVSTLYAPVTAVFRKCAR